MSLVSGGSTVNDVTLEIRGPVGAHDDVPEHPTDVVPLDQENGYEQVMCYSSAGAPVVTLGGPLRLELSPSYTPTLGDEYVLYFSHAFNPFFGEEPGAELQYTDAFRAAVPGLLAGMPELADPSWFYAADLGTEAFSIGVQVPEPGTFVLLATGVVGLLLIRRRKS